MEENYVIDDPEIPKSENLDKQPSSDFHCITKFRKENLSYTWSIENFQEFSSKENNVVFSGTFSLKKSPHLNWQLVLKVGGNEKPFLHLELHHLKTLSIPYNIFLKAKISILGNNLNSKHFITTFKGYSKESDKWVKEEFLSKNLLVEQEDEFLSQNCLVIFCEISQSGQFNNEIGNIRSSKDRGLEDFSKLFENPLFTDAIIKVQGHDFKVHKSIIAARSSVFMAMFNPESKMKEQEEGIAVINDTPIKTFREILRYIYTGLVENIEGNVSDLIVAADKYDLSGLRLRCAETMYNILSAKNATDFLEIADNLNMIILKEKISKFIKGNLSDVMEQDNWNNFLRSNTDLATEFLKMQIA